MKSKSIKNHLSPSHIAILQPPILVSIKPHDMFELNTNRITRGHTLKLILPKFKTSIRIFVFCHSSSRMELIA